MHATHLCKPRSPGTREPACSQIHFSHRPLGLELVRALAQCRTIRLNIPPTFKHHSKGGTWLERSIRSLSQVLVLGIGWAYPCERRGVEVWG